MSKKREKFIVRCKVGPKGLSSSLAITKDQNQKKDCVMTTGNQ